MSRGRDLTLASATFRAVVALITGLDAFKATAWKATALLSAVAPDNHRAESEA